ncbi:hypothetical protein SAICODRAFT_19373 [Saitoella complicata NRRL Y-17804]|uniref:MICOS complex subunit MIC12 n=1 Tax=Saitoella complicata (strain BCRC 22490 / CBS 7301 / JCM 7358 / NBRC 10748 / NRRL Y-17804) TaxID=698492 RepID=A0A0E9NGT6_SAICN|nr:uncharacterized protein SAICODRAFT_19373 [Saitoella complicata NRRL Y-17804]ODQ53010.1 hypothetical protein SAICODRAFT_19373 [Saitoella complicata NRRL Y-17804]GAO49023.1 hypothetical protein G7K_3184-t1 [Saitoella complicata NRRL Y-17804]
MPRLIWPVVSGVLLGTSVTYGAYLHMTTTANGIKSSLDNQRAMFDSLNAPSVPLDLHSTHIPRTFTEHLADRWNAGLESGIRYLQHDVDYAAIPSEIVRLGRRGWEKVQQKIDEAAEKKAEAVEDARRSRVNEKRLLTDEHVERGKREEVLIGKA